jgi:hypothetical protein
MTTFIVSEKKIESFGEEIVSLYSNVMEFGLPKGVRKPSSILTIIHII